MRERLIYFIKPVGMDGPIKIGCTSVLERRLHGFTIWSPFPLEVVATHPGDFGVELAIHRVFAAAHSHREWFRPVPELVKAIERIKAGVPLTEAIDLTKPVGNIRIWRGKPRQRRAPKQEAA